MTRARRARSAGLRADSAPRSIIPNTVIPNSGAPDSAATGAEAPDRFVFTAAQLSVYGVYELQTLESILRRNETAGDSALSGRREIARRIRAKIGWPDSIQSDETQMSGRKIDESRFDATAFLEAFYAAQRAYLERRMLFGHRRRDKHDKS